MATPTTWAGSAARLGLRWRSLLLGAALALGATSCSLKSLALNSVADTMSGTGTVYARDDDPELVRDAIPFALKTMEQLADALPAHVGIRVALARTCTSLAIGFYKDDAERTEDRDVAASKPMWRRAKKLLLRARTYALEAVELRAPGARKALEQGNAGAQDAALARLQKGDVELLYWLAASWAGAISSGKDDMKLVGELPRVGRVIDRALALDEAWDKGALHEFLVLFDSARSVDQGGGPKKARAHYDRALVLGENKKLSPHVSLAETAMVDAQNRKEFKRLLSVVVAADVDAYPEYRLVNLLARRRAEYLLERIDELFAE